MSPTFTDDEIGKRVENANGDRLGMVTAIESGTAYVEPDPGIADSIKATLGWESATEDALELDESEVSEIDESAVRIDDASLVPMMDTETDRTDREDRNERETGAVSDEPADSRRPEIGDVEREDRDDATRDEPETEPAGETSGLDETDAAEEMEMRGTEVDRADELDAIERERSARGAEVDPSELTDREPEAELRPEEAGRRSDAEVEPDTETSRSDAEVDPESESRRTDAEIDPEAIRDEESTEDGARTDREGDRNRNDD